MLPSTFSGITGDGRCMFRSVAYGACLRRGHQLPSESIQKELADELRAKVTELLMILFVEHDTVPCNCSQKEAYSCWHICGLFQVADEFIERRGDTEWWSILPLTILRWTHLFPAKMKKKYSKNGKLNWTTRHSDSTALAICFSLYFIAKGSSNVKK